MATAKPVSPPRRRGRLRKLALPLLLLAAAVLVAFWPRISGLASAGAAVGARVACSCRYVGGRELGDCRKDFEPGMGVVVLSEDAAAKTVTARVPLLSAQTASYRPGEGCLLEPWTD